MHAMESTIQVACGVLSFGPIGYMPWVSDALTEPVRIENGQMFPPQKPGLGLEIRKDVIQKYRVEQHNIVIFSICCRISETFGYEIVSL
jgi:L-alanine-DL-glutamate epimerase-like enolase superfamily enzyme